ncbi:precorrin-6y C5,15-methyltransferase (decarboxylating) subunit CbiE [Acetobacteraceae bacterium KSS8]|uniref:Precorrin-6y C5,15-methyltransferase (Decarboxylating) subunit CbiE n=1 Tax=Endosaccharibacter trunci TaxID=2812733 RepID=A0ABT1W2J5_9PROT|nr:precorrin-6y C5,15-methyltransferase (decarboxylating) subunit CbiE [Acetobacteraceae bacterium KSS8]
MTAWLSILGIGEDGVEGLREQARALLRNARLVVGGKRHLALAAPLIGAKTLPWPSPMEGAIPSILAHRGEPVVVLASGDPFCFGVGSLLMRHVAPAEMLCLPAPSAFSLACARLGWSLQDSAQLSICGRPIETLLPALQPGARLLVLCADASSPEAVRNLLVAHGFGGSRIVLLEALGGPRERVTELSGPPDRPVAALNMLAIELVAGPDARPIPLATGLPDRFFEHDGQITKQEIRAATLAALQPFRGGVLWDIGAGSGSVGIEWMLRHPANRAVALEPRADRAARTARNAASLGVPDLLVLPRAAPEGLDGLATPDAVFVGGGAAIPGVLERCWAALRPGGRLVVNAVTIETEAVLFDAHARWGGALTRLSVERLDRIGTMRGFRPAMTVTQYAVVHP